MRRTRTRMSGERGQDLDNIDKNKVSHALIIDNEIT